MLAAIERGDIDGFAVWEPWPTRTLQAVKGTEVLQPAEGIYNDVGFVRGIAARIRQQGHRREVRPCRWYRPTI